MTIALVWFRQDLRLNDNPAFVRACAQHKYVISLYIYDERTSILGEAQAWWLHHSLISLNQSLERHDLSLVLRKGSPLEIILELIEQKKITTVYWNRCYEPLAIERDKKIKASLLKRNIEVETYNGSLLNEPWTIMNKSESYFKVFTPYWKTCRASMMIPNPLKVTRYPSHIRITSDKLSTWGLLPKINWYAKFPEYWMPGEKGAQKKLEKFIECHLSGYKKNRNIPEKNATSHLSPHLHFGEISPWTIVRAISLASLDHNGDVSSSEHFLSELGWREFSIYLLYHFPELPHKNFRSEFDEFPWITDQEALFFWQKGMTGYPIIDAGMRELWATGYMHNRLRMITASFLIKDLLIDWRKGAGWFLNTLVDADLANNSTNWQWVAGCGVDAAPYFRIFNPTLQSQKFDPHGEYIRKWVPELKSLDDHVIHNPWENIVASKIASKNDYPQPIIQHQEARIRALKSYNHLKKPK